MRRSPEFTERDASVLDLFRSIRFAETSDLAAVLVPDPFPTAHKLRLRLSKLAALGYLDRPARRIKPERTHDYELTDAGASRGRPQDVWALAQKGAAFLGLAGDWNKNNGRLRPSSFAHPLMVTRLFCTLRLAASKGLIDIESWLGENAWRDRVRVGSDTLPMVPDATFQISDNRTDMTAPVFLEVDNKTAPLSRTNLVQTSFLKKCTTYWHYWDQVIRPQPDQGMIVLTIAKTPERAESLRLTAARTDRHGRGLNLFWFTSEDRWSITSPETFLYRPIWKTAAGETRSLFKCP